MDSLNNIKSILIKSGIALVIILSLYFLVKTISEIKSYAFIGGGATASNIITFNGKGEVSATPDLATVNLTIREEAKEMKDAQAKVTTKETAILAFLEKSEIAKADIKTENYNSSPKYDYGVPCYSGMNIPCRQDAPKIIGYEVSEYISVKIHDVTKVGEIVKSIGAVGISEIIGPNFSIENEDQLKEQARKLAIDEAKAKAESLSQDLGVRLIRIVSFSENGNYPGPMYAMGMAKTDSISSYSPTPVLPVGENKITSNVSITYEIR